MSSRILTKEERRLLVDALRAAAKVTRRTKADALADQRFLCGPAQAAHVDRLAERAHTQDRLASELNDHEIHLEKETA